MGANWAGASERAVGVALLRVGEGVVLHLVVPGLHVERGRLIPGDVSENDCVVRRGRFPPRTTSAYNVVSAHKRRAVRADGGVKRICCRSAARAKRNNGGLTLIWRQVRLVKSDWIRADILTADLIRGGDGSRPCERRSCFRTRP